MRTVAKTERVKEPRMFLWFSWGNRRAGGGSRTHTHREV